MNWKLHKSVGNGPIFPNPFATVKLDQYMNCQSLPRTDDVLNGFDKQLTARGKKPELISSISELEGMNLGCWCNPSPCHGDILIKLFIEIDSEQIKLWENVGK